MRYLTLLILISCGQSETLQPTPLPQGNQLPSCSASTIQKYEAVVESSNLLAEAIRVSSPDVQSLAEQMVVDCDSFFENYPAKCGYSTTVVDPNRIAEACDAALSLL